MTRLGRPAALLALAAVCTLAGSAAAFAEPASAPPGGAPAETTARGVGTITVYGNPTLTPSGDTQVPVTPPPFPVDGVPAQAPTSLPPRGSNPGTHMYVSAQSGSPAGYGALALAFRDLRGARVTSLKLVISDDPGTGAQVQLNNTGDVEDVMPEAAVLAACPLSQAPTAENPNATVAFTCGDHPVLGTRVVNPADAVGTWTFDLTALAGPLTSAGSSGIGIIPQPTGQQTYSVAFLHGTATAPYTSSGGQPLEGLPPLPASITPAGGGLPRRSATSAPATRRPGVITPATLPAPAAAPAPSAPGPAEPAPVPAAPAALAPAAPGHTSAAPQPAAGIATPAPAVAEATSPLPLTGSAVSFNPRQQPFLLPPLLLVLLPLAAGLLLAYGDRLPLRVSVLPARRGGATPAEPTPTGANS